MTPTRFDVLQSGENRVVVSPTAARYTRMTKSTESSTNVLQAEVLQAWSMR